MAARRHFQTFDALRFISFFLVFLLHVPVPEVSFFSFFSKSGGIGVSFFFVLSGFLISYILMHDKQENGSIQLKNFMVRRVLRIWPLFYAMILFAYLSPWLLHLLHLPNSSEGYAPNLAASMLFLENYKMMFTGDHPNASPLGVMWSLCIEEHFYILWGVVMLLIPLKRIPVFILACIFVAKVARPLYAHWGYDSLDLFTNIDFFAYGSIPAYILIKKETWLIRVGEVPVYLKYLVAAFTLFVVLALPHIQARFAALLSPDLTGILFALIILFTLPPKNALYVSDGKLISRLGKYTYGLYLIHTIVINLFLQLQNMLGLQWHWTVVGLLSLVSTILLSMASYHLFEKQFLKLKVYFR